MAKVGSSARFELISSFALASQSSFVSINRNKRPMSSHCSLTALKSEEFTLSSATFKLGGVYRKIHLVTFLYIFLLVDCFTLCSASFKLGGSICLWYLHVFSMQWYFLISSYYLTVSNGLSLTTWKSEEFTLSSGSFKWGG